MFSLTPVSTKSWEQNTPFYLNGTWKTLLKKKKKKARSPFHRPCAAVVIMHSKQLSPWMQATWQGAVSLQGKQKQAPHDRSKKAWGRNENQGIFEAARRLNMWREFAAQHILTSKHHCLLCVLTPQTWRLHVFAVAYLAFAMKQGSTPPPKYLNRIKKRKRKGLSLFPPKKDIDIWACSLDVQKHETVNVKDQAFCMFILETNPTTFKYHVQM